MNARTEQWLADALARWVVHCCRRGRRVVALLLALTAALASYAVATLGVDTDNKKLISPRLPFQQHWQAFARRFPTLDDSLLIVVDAETPELARDASRALAERLALRADLFSDVFIPGADPFFERHGLLYRSVGELEEFIDQLSRMQPFLAELAREQTLANLARLVRRGLEQLEQDGSAAEAWPLVLESFGRAAVAVYHEYPVHVSWEQLLLEGSGFDPGRRRVIVAEPLLEFDRLLAAAGSLQEMRRAALELGLVPEQGVEVRITGNPALNYEEMRGLIWDIGVAGLVSFALVMGVLILALGSLRVVAAAAVTLIAGLAWTAAFAAAAVGRLSLVSVCFAVLFVGLGVDFAIHLGTQYLEQRSRAVAHAQALTNAVRRVASSLVLCTLTTAIGFYCFVPTDFRGVGELGLIAGTGMFVILFLTLTLFPPLLGRSPAIRVRHGGIEEFVRRRTLLATRRHPGLVVAAAAVAGLLAVALLPRARFDANVVEMRDPGTESVQAFEDLLTDSRTSPWTIDVLAPDLAAADELAGQLRQLEVVDRVLTLSDYVPSDQDEKLEILSEAAFLLYLPEGDGADPSAALPVVEQIAALRDLHAVLDPELLQGRSPLAASGRLLRRELGRFLERVDGDPRPHAALRDLERRLLASFPEQLRRLETALQAERIAMENLPPDLVRRMRAGDGSARVQVLAREDLGDPAALERFVDAVRWIAPQATGLPVNLIEFGRETAASLREALLIALGLITLLLGLLWRRVADVARVLLVLLLGAALTGAAVVLLGMPFNFANVIVIPLLLGIGVDSGIHLMHRARHPEGADPEVITSATTRAVFYSTVTTVASFGSLALSSHRGIASLGQLLVIGMALMTLCNLVVLPALIGWRAPRERASGPRGSGRAGRV